MEKTLARTPANGFLVCGLAYVTALAVAAGAGYACRGLHPVWAVLVADAAATLVVYAFGRAYRNSSLYDPYWSVAPPVIALAWLLGTGGGVAARQVLVIVMVLAWGGRLTFNWARRWQGLRHEDWRYADLRKSRGTGYWAVELTGIELMPTALVFLGCLALFPALTIGLHPFNLLDVIAVIVTGAAIGIEAAADAQLTSFLRENPARAMDRGLWKYSRHPNYFGEITFWWGLWLFGLAAAAGWWWTIVGPLAITALFVFISVPMMEKRNLARRPEYAGYRQRTAPLVPWFPRREAD